MEVALGIGGSIVALGVFVIWLLVKKSGDAAEAKTERKHLEIDHEKADNAAKTRARPVLTGARLRRKLRAKLQRMREQNS